MAWKIASLVICSPMEGMLLLSATARCPRIGPHCQSNHLPSFLEVLVFSRFFNESMCARKSKEYDVWNLTCSLGDKLVLIFFLPSVARIRHLKASAAGCFLLFLGFIEVRFIVIQTDPDFLQRSNILCSSFRKGSASSSTISPDQYASCSLLLLVSLYHTAGHAMAHVGAQLVTRKICSVAGLYAIAW
jgi:hypothetical protein